MTERKDRFVSVVIPLYNEEESLAELYARLTEVLDGSVRRHELVFVDDGSTDGSLGTLRELRSGDRRVKIVSFKRNNGKSAALQQGFKVSRGDVVVTIDADLQDDPNEIPGLIDRLDEGFDLVSGWKRNRRDPPSKTIPSKIFNFVTSLVSGIKLHDFNCGLKAYRRDVVERISVYGELHRFIPVLAAWEGFRVAEKGVAHFERKFGRSKYGANRLLNGLFDLITVMFITRRAASPLHFFGRIAFVFFVVGGGISLYFIILWLSGHGLHVRPLMVGGLVMIVIAIQIGSFGLLAELYSSGQERTFSIREYEIDD
ncbi:MAG TPA: glycosyltransferase [Candidatus Eisenbacteria bacterium]|uniref:Glycosyltransferase n=1 Tax=Eiseniibacteriota bacterium TaxID=2212470 RepID=A0A7V2ATW3_UNCEI|nr:glycosyltransferase [Candidatus Eisenbacteria bacterium]